MPSSSRKSTKKSSNIQSNKLQYSNQIINSSNKKNKKSDNSQSNIKNVFKYSCSLATINKLTDFLLKTAQVQRKLQILKQMLCEEQDFTPASLFNRIDKNRRGYLSEQDVQLFLNDHQVPFKGSQLKVLYGKMNNIHNDDGVSLRQFQNFILPNQNPKLRYLTMRRPVYIPLPSQQLSQKIQWISAKLFSQIIGEQFKLMNNNNTLISSFDFKPEQIFDILSKNGFITAQSLHNYLIQNNKQPTIQQIGCIIKIIDRKGQGRVYLDDFKYFLATLGLKKQHQIFDQLSPIPALKNYISQINQHNHNNKNRDYNLITRLLDNKAYAQEFHKKVELQKSRNTRLSRSRRNY